MSISNAAFRPYKSIRTKMMVLFFGLIFNQMISSISTFSLNCVLYSATFIPYSNLNGLYTRTFGIKHTIIRLPDEGMDANVRERLLKAIYLKATGSKKKKKMMTFFV